MNEKKEYLNEEEYQKNNAKLKKVGKTVLIVGICMLALGAILTLIGFLSFGNTAVSSTNMDVVDESSIVKGIFGGFGLLAIGGAMDGISLPLMMIGGVIMFIAHRREITAYATQQVMPVAKEGIEKIAPTIGKAGASIAKEMAPVYGEIAKEIGKGIKEGINEADKK